MPVHTTRLFALGTPTWVVVGTGRYAAEIMWTPYRDRLRAAIHVEAFSFDDHCSTFVIDDGWVVQVTKAKDVKKRALREDEPVPKGLVDTRKPLFPFAPPPTLPLGARDTPLKVSVVGAIGTVLSIDFEADGLGDALNDGPAVRFVVDDGVLIRQEDLAKAKRASAAARKSERLEAVLFALGEKLANDDDEITAWDNDTQLVEVTVGPSLRTAAELADLQEAHQATCVVVGNGWDINTNVAYGLTLFAPITMARLVSRTVSGPDDHARTEKAIRGLLAAGCRVVALSHDRLVLRRASKALDAEAIARALGALDLDTGDDDEGVIASLVEDIQAGKPTFLWWD